MEFEHHVVQDFRVQNTLTHMSAVVTTCIDYYVNAHETTQKVHAPE